MKNTIYGLVVGSMKEGGMRVVCNVKASRWKVKARVYLFVIEK